MTAPDPKTVREIAREAVRRGGSDSGYGFIGSVISDHAAMDEMLASGDRAAFGRLHAAVRAELKGATITVEWPDEQQPANVVTAEQQQGGVVEALRVWLASRTGDDQLGQDVRAALDNREAWRNLARSRGVERDAARAEVARAWEDLTTVREERTALAARVAELESEREADARAVGSLMEAVNEDVPRAREYLRGRFVDRIDAFTQHDANGGAE